MSSLYAKRRERFLQSMEPGSVAIFPTAPEVRRSNDSEFPFRPDSDHFYLTGFREPEAVCVLAKDAKKKTCTMFVRPRDKERETWTGRREGPEGAKKSWGADDAFTFAQLDERMPALLENSTSVYYFLGRYPEFDSRVTGWINTVKSRARLMVLPPRDMKDPAPILHEMRLYKNDDDLALLRKAVSITAEGHREAMAACRPGMKEYELQAVIEYIFKKRGADSVGYNSIVGTGINATILHYVVNKDTLKDGELLLLDAGAEVDCFTGDITRTYPVSGRFSDVQKRVYDIVLDAQKKAIAACKPGTPFQKVHDIATRVLVEGMVALKLVEGSVDGAIESGAYKKFYMHRTSHWLGMDVHDVGDYYRIGGDSRALEPGMVLTIEPGLYVSPDETLPKGCDEKLRGIGIRIEDDVLITSSGHDVLSKECPKEIADVEKEMARTSVFA